MTDFSPIPLPTLINRLFRELDARKSGFGLPSWKFARSAAGRDFSTSIFGRTAATPFGPAAGPHTQLAQNIVLGWLAGGRVIELKTVQILDHLDIARPCIDMETVGFNIEWSQELTLEQSLEEYVKASMLIAMLKAEGIAPDLGDTVIDMSAGYDLAGIRSDKVQTFLRGMKDAGVVIERLRGQIPAAYARFRDLAYDPCISDTITVSTFHGCPPEEIEAIAAHLLQEVGLDVVVKLNPTLLGKDELNAILHDRLGYTALKVPDSTFAKDAKWPQVTAMVERLGTLADRLGRGFGVKFSNTLLVENHRHFFPAGTPEMYLSGPPLHVLAIALVKQFRDRFGDRYPISFSAGIDVGNFADAVALGLKPVSVCTDLLKGAGYGKGTDYIADLADRMAEVGAVDIDTFTLLAFGEAEAALAGLPAATRQAATAALAAGSDLRAAAGADFAAWVSAARLLNTSIYAERVLTEARYAFAANSTGPRKTDVPLDLLDCETCGKCVSVCPNAAIFRYGLPQTAVTAATLLPGTPPTVRPGEARPIRMKQQIGICADICNQCGNCDVTCPESGAPYARKAQVFGSPEALLAAAGRDGFTVTGTGPDRTILLRLDGAILSLHRAEGRLCIRGDGVDLSVDPADPTIVAGASERPLDLGRLLLVERIADAVSTVDAHTFLAAALN
jgi:putative selenate reductase